MIRFKTIEPVEQDKPTKKSAMAAPAVVAPPASEPAVDDASATPKKGLTRKTPLRPKKADAARLFRD